MPSTLNDCAIEPIKRDDQLVMNCLSDQGQINDTLAFKMEIVETNTQEEQRYRWN